jgi:hypothetical protein
VTTCGRLCLRVSGNSIAFLSGVENIENSEELAVNGLSKKSKRIVFFSLLAVMFKQGFGTDH